MKGHFASTTTSETHIREGGTVASKGRLSIDRKAGTGVFSETKKAATDKRTAKDAVTAPSTTLTGRRPTQKIFLAEEMPSPTRRAMAKLLKDLDG